MFVSSVGPVTQLQSSETRENVYPSPLDDDKQQILVSDSISIKKCLLFSNSFSHRLHLLTNSIPLRKYYQTIDKLFLIKHLGRC